jgi:hypothetical protein
MPFVAAKRRPTRRATASLPRWSAAKSERARLGRSRCAEALASHDA